MATVQKYSRKKKMKNEKSARVPSSRYRHFCLKQVRVNEKKYDEKKTKQCLEYFTSASATGVDFKIRFSQVIWTSSTKQNS